MSERSDESGHIYATHLDQVDSSFRQTQDATPVPPPQPEGALTCTCLRSSDSRPQRRGRGRRSPSLRQQVGQNPAEGLPRCTCPRRHEEDDVSPYQRRLAPEIAASYDREVAGSCRRGKVDHRQPRREAQGSSSLDAEPSSLADSGFADSAIVQIINPKKQHYNRSLRNSLRRPQLIIRDGHTQPPKQQCQVMEEARQCSRTTTEQALHSRLGQSECTEEPIPRDGTQSKPAGHRAGNTRKTTMKSRKRYAFTCVSKTEFSVSELSSEHGTSPGHQTRVSHQSDCSSAVWTCSEERSSVWDVSVSRQEGQRAQRFQQMCRSVSLSSGSYPGCRISEEAPHPNPQLHHHHHQHRCQGLFYERRTLTSTPVRAEVDDIVSVKCSRLEQQENSQLSQEHHSHSVFPLGNTGACVRLGVREKQLDDYTLAACTCQCQCGYEREVPASECKVSRRIFTQTDRHGAELAGNYLHPPVSKQDVSVQHCHYPHQEPERPSWQDAANATATQQSNTKKGGSRLQDADDRQKTRTKKLDPRCSSTPRWRIQSADTGLSGAVTVGEVRLTPAGPSSRRQQELANSCLQAPLARLRTVVTSAAGRTYVVCSSGGAGPEPLPVNAAGSPRQYWGPDVKQTPSRTARPAGGVEAGGVKADGRRGGGGSQPEKESPTNYSPPPINADTESVRMQRTVLWIEAQFASKAAAYSASTCRCVSYRGSRHLFLVGTSCAFCDNDSVPVAR